MFRLALMSMIALRVICCPVLCTGCGEGTRIVEDAQAHVCACSASESETCDGQAASTPLEQPSDCPCPCKSEGQCEVTLDLSRRSVDFEAFFAVDFVLCCFETVDISQAFNIRGYEPPPHCDLECGRDIRVAHASFLL